MYVMTRNIKNVTGFEIDNFADIDNMLIEKGVLNL